MNLPSITLNRVGGKWVPLYVGDDADEAKKAAHKITNGEVESEGGFLFIRPEYTRRLRVPKAEAPKVEAPEQPKAEAPKRKRGKT